MSAPKIRGASFCSGIGAPETALPEWDWKWCAEMAPFPSAVLATRHPKTVNLNDLTDPDFAKRALETGEVDVIFGGTPCQSFSTAGLRRGLADPRGNIMITAISIYQQLCTHARKNNTRPPLYVWENVPGALTADAGKAFGSFLGSLAGLSRPMLPPEGKGWGSAGLVAGPSAKIAWRVLNAQYFGVPQRRRRVFAVVSAGNIDPGEILFESRTTGTHCRAWEVCSPGRPRIVPESDGTLKPFGFDHHSSPKGYVQIQPTSTCLLASNPPTVFDGTFLRRMTPREMERVQGFPDDYTAIQYLGKDASDARRSHALGNSMAVPVIRWLGQRIERALRVSEQSPGPVPSGA